MRRSPGPLEAGLAEAWRDRRYHPPVVDSFGRELRVVFPGRRSGAAGPDFRDGVFATADGQLVTGDIEIHRRAADWYSHGHAVDPAYSGVVLHVVGQGPATPVTHDQGGTIPTILLRIAPVQPALQLFLSCPPEDRELAARALDTAGDAWLAERIDRFRGAIDLVGADQAIWAALLDALGFGGNRDGFRILAETIPWEQLSGFLAGRSAEQRLARAQALLAGAGGLTTDPSVVDLWRSLGAPAPLQPIRWLRTGLRPPNFPERRIPAAAGLAASFAMAGPADWTGHLVTGSQTPKALIAGIRAAASGLGEDRAASMAVDVLLPAALALENDGRGPQADGTRDDRFHAADDASQRIQPSAFNLRPSRSQLSTFNLQRSTSRAFGLFKRFPRLPENQITRAMIDLIFAPDSRHYVTSARRQQGALWVYRRWCRDKNCAECLVGRVKSEE